MNSSPTHPQGTIQEKSWASAVYLPSTWFIQVHVVSYRRLGPRTGRISATRYVQRSSLIAGAGQAHLLRGALGGGGKSGSRPLPLVEEVLVDPPRRSEPDEEFEALDFGRPGMLMEKVCPSFNE
jgi:hypothetical protein